MNIIPLLTVFDQLILPFVGMFFRKIFLISLSLRKHLMNIPTNNRISNPKDNKQCGDNIHFFPDEDLRYPDGKCNDRQAGNRPEPGASPVGPAPVPDDIDVFRASVDRCICIAGKIWNTIWQFILGKQVLV